MIRWYFKSVYHPQVLVGVVKILEFYTYIVDTIYMNYKPAMILAVIYSVLSSTAWIALGEMYSP